MLKQFNIHSSSSSSSSSSSTTIDNNSNNYNNIIKLSTLSLSLISIPILLINIYKQKYKSLTKYETIPYGWYIPFIGCLYEYNKSASQLARKLKKNDEQIYANFSKNGKLYTIVYDKFACDKLLGAGEKTISFINGWKNSIFKITTEKVIKHVPEKYKLFRKWAKTFKDSPNTIMSELYYQYDLYNLFDYKDGKLSPKKEEFVIDDIHESFHKIAGAASLIQIVGNPLEYNHRDYFEKLNTLAKEYLTVIYLGTEFPNVKKYEQRIEEIQFDFLDLALDEFRRRYNGKRIRKSLKGNEDFKDLIDYCIELKNEDPKKFDDLWIANKIKGGIVAAIISSPRLSASTLQLLLRFPNQYEQIEEEIHNAFNDPLLKNENEIMHKLLKLEAAAKESLRFISPPLLMRTVMKDFELPGTDIILPKGRELLLSADNLQLSSDVWGDDSQKFDFNHFIHTTDPVVEGKKGFFGFGVPPHLCLGRDLGLVEVQMLLSYLIYYYDIIDLGIDTNNKYIKNGIVDDTEIKRLTVGPSLFKKRKLKFIPKY